MAEPHARLRRSDDQFTPKAQKTHTIHSKDFPRFPIGGENRVPIQTPEGKLGKEDHA